jgi:hypothetical protein
VSLRPPLTRSLFAALTSALALLLALIAAAPASAAPYRGIQTHSLWGATPSSDIPKEMELLRNAGANMVRVDVGWSSLETSGDDDYADWYVDKLDRLVAEADARGIKVVAGLWGTPCWASSAPETLKQGCAGDWWNRGVVQYPPRNPADYGDVARWLTKRYGTKLAALEVWNEPNLAGGGEDRFWTSSDEVGDYAALVRAAYGPAKQGNADVPVVIGALAAADRPWLDQLYARGIKGHYDGISIHPYNEWRDPADMWQERWKMYTLIPGIRWVREGQQAAGDNTPLWITEFGWPTCEGGRWCVSEAQQAEYTAKSVPMLEAIPYLAAYAVYDLRNEGHDSTRMDDNFGLVREDYSPKPAYNALKAAWGGQLPAPAPGTAGVSPGTAGATPGDLDAGSGDPSAGSASLTPASDGRGARLRVRVRRGKRHIVVWGKAAAGTTVVIQQCRRRPCAKNGRGVGMVRTTRAGSNGRLKLRMPRLSFSRKPGVRVSVAGDA